MKKRIKMLFEQVLLVSFLINLAVGIEGVYFWIKDGEFYYRAILPFSVIIGSILTCLPSGLIYTEEVVKPAVRSIRIALHAVITCAVIMLTGYVFKWYTNFNEALYVFVAFVVIYILVWIVMYWLGKSDEKAINNALELYNGTGSE